MGCVMGILLVVNLSYIYVDFFEMKSLFVNFKEYRRFINDRIGIWDYLLPDSEEKYQDFLSRLNNRGKLK